MPEGNAPFSTEEYDRRIALTRAAMQAAGIDVLFVTDPSNQAWLTGYDGWSFYVHQGVILPLEGDPVWWGRHMDAKGARRTVLDGQDNISSATPTTTCSRPSATRCRTSRGGSRRMGCADGAHRRRDGELLLLGQGPCRALRRSCRTPRWSMPPRW